MAKKSASLIKEMQELLDASDLSIQVRDFTDTGDLTLKLVGACANCPSGQAEFQETMENIFWEKFPEIKEIHWETGVSDELIQEALQFLRRNQGNHSEKN
jgi:Thioredoxin-like proteins and domains